MLEDAKILGGTKIKQDEGRTLAVFVLPNGEEFVGEFEDIEQMRKKATAWCASVRDRWKWIEEKRERDMLEGIPAQSKEVKTVAQPEMSTRDILYNRYCHLQSYKEKVLKDQAKIEEDLAQVNAELEDLAPVLKKWGMIE